MNKKHNIKKNSLITFDYQVYDLNQQLITSGTQENMIVGQDSLFPNLSKSLLTLDVNQTKHAFNFVLQNPNNTFSDVIFNLTIKDYSENNAELFNNNFEKQQAIKQSKNEKQLVSEISNLEKKLLEFEKNEEKLNAKIHLIFEKAQDEIKKFKESTKQKHNTEIQEQKDFQFQSFFEKILNPLNNLYMAVEFGIKRSENSELVGYIKGFELLINQMFNVLDSFGVIPIEPKIGDEFNPEFHNIVELIATKEFKKDKIVEIRSRGYQLNGRVIFPANVIVSKK